MKLLFIHADHLAYEARKPALKTPPPLPPEGGKGSADEALVVFYCVEAADAADLPAVVERTVAEVQDVLGQVKAERVVLYPYAHLSQSLARPNDAQKGGELLFASAKEKLGVPVQASPFGYYKAFEIKAKGHPLAELSRSVTLGGPASGPAAVALVNKPAKGAPTASGVAASTQKESEALQKEKKLVSSWFILTPEAKLVPASEYDFSKDKEFESFYRYETQGTRQAGEEPPHVRLMRELELVDYEPAADAGNFRWYPKGQLIKRLLQEQCSEVIRKAGGMRVETPIMYDYEHPALKRYLDRFPARQYILRSEDKDYFLRFAACFGQYMIFHDMVMGRKDLPVRLYELTHYSFRREQTGELSGLRRLRTFTMPDMHTLTADMEQAKAEFLAQFRLCQQWMSDIGVPYNAALRFVRSFYDENPEFVRALAKENGRPMVVEMWEDRFFYFVTKMEFHPLDTQGRAAALSTVQIDVENGERFGIQYTDSDGKRKHPIILHNSVPGAIERNLYAILENEAKKMSQGKKGALPFWLAPVQVRLLPVSDTFNDACLKIAKELEDRCGVRVDLDDRDEGIGRKIRDAEKEWVPLILVYGEKESGGAKFSVRTREGPNLALSLDELVSEILKRQGDKPRASLGLPTRLNLRPTFRG
ncbi:MAG: threonine--tRNA ligase [Euryarchaeota archaeon]|nr:threonine--tRNA ligase [Euryarchaeota archaeon]MDE2046166.1 threonine--tRNA ligase [Thermoplasmata archaeon]